MDTCEIEFAMCPPSIVCEHRKNVRVLDAKKCISQWGELQYRPLAPTSERVLELARIYGYKYTRAAAAQKAALMTIVCRRLTRPVSHYGRVCTHKFH